MLTTDIGRTLKVRASLLLEALRDGVAVYRDCSEDGKSTPTTYITQNADGSVTIASETKLISGLFEHVEIVRDEHAAKSEEEGTHVQH